MGEPEGQITRGTSEADVSFKVTIEKTEDLVRAFRIEVPEEWVHEEESRACSALRPYASVKGFRKGKASLAIVKREYREEILQMVLERVIREAEATPLKEMGLVSIGEGQVAEVVREPGKGLSCLYAATIIEKAQIPDATRTALSETTGMRGGRGPPRDWPVTCANAACATFTSAGWRATFVSVGAPKMQLTPAFACASYGI